IVDGDYGSFYIKRLPPSMIDWVNDCYGLTGVMGNMGLAVGPQEFQLLLPVLHVAGRGKCGTSAIFQFFGDHTDYIAAHLGKEYCPRKGLYKYFRGMSKAYTEMYSQERIMVLGCISPLSLMPIHRILKPKAVYVYSVRELPEKQWSAYNFYVTASTTGQPPACMFDEMLRSLNYPDQQQQRLESSCTSMNTEYLTSILRQTLHPEQFVMISLDQLSSPHPEPALRRLETALQWMGRAVVLEAQHLHFVNSGNDK
ncbi:hypothetical protein B484DRAFT_405229, partial [Ochromonadaceae sp. CCMP2298]